MTETEKKKIRAKAAKLSNPKPRELPSGAWRCEKMVNGIRISETDEDPAVAHAKVNAIAAGLIAKAKGTSNVTFGEAYAAYIKKNENIFSPSTLLGYDRVKKNHLEDISKLPMSSLSQSLIQSKVNALAKTKSPKTVSNIYGVITSVYYDFFQDRKLSINLPQKDNKEIQIPTEDEIKKISEACRGTVYELPILLAMDLGLRASEICGLKWDCIEGDRIHIKNAIVAGKGGLKEKKPKSSSGDRWLHIPPHIKEMLDNTPRVNDRIVQITGQAMGKGFSRICEKNGIRHFRFHDLRHVFASVSIALNIPTEYIRKDMGHKSDNMIKAVYGHMMEEARKEHSDRRAEYYQAIRAKKEETTPSE